MLSRDTVLAASRQMSTDPDDADAFPFGAINTTRTSIVLV